MASGYTCCIDFEKIKESIETLSSMETCMNNKDFTSTFLEIEEQLRNVNFEHNNCITNYKEPISSILEKISNIKREIEGLQTSLEKTINDFRNIEDITSNDLQTITNLYDKSNAKDKLSDLLRINDKIKISNNSTIFQEYTDDSIRNFMIKNSLESYPNKFHSVEEWKSSLMDNYQNTNMSIYEKQDRVDRDMAVWRQQQSNSSVTTLASSDYAEQQVNISIEKLSSPKVELKETDIAATVINDTNNQIVDTTPNNPNVTQIPKETTVDSTAQTMNATTSNDINTIPIGLGIAAAGITGSIGAVIVDSEKRKRTDNLEYYKDPEEEEKNNPNTEIKYDPIKPVILSETPYHASRNKESINKFYGENIEYYEEEDNEQ